MLEAEAQGGAQVVSYLGGTWRFQVPPKMAADETVDQVGDAVSEQQPHGAEMPGQTSAQPAAQAGPSVGAGKEGWARRCRFPSH